MIEKGALVAVRIRTLRLWPPKSQIRHGVRDAELAQQGPVRVEAAPPVLGRLPTPGLANRRICRRWVVTYRPKASYASTVVDKRHPQPDERKLSGAGEGTRTPNRPITKADAMCLTWPLRATTATPPSPPAAMNPAS
jgi:hypothetical protein